jgi:hypothetical protein
MLHFTYKLQLHRIAVIRKSVGHGLDTRLGITVDLSLETSGFGPETCGLGLGLSTCGLVNIPGKINKFLRTQNTCKCDKVEATFKYNNPFSTNDSCYVRNNTTNSQL